MILNEDNYREKIKSYKREDWQPLLELIPEIEKTSKFGKMIVGEENENGVFQMPYIKKNPVVIKFIKVVYEIPIMISFNWMAWDEGERIADNQFFDFNSIDILTKCKLITAIVRNDRFCEGALVTEFESGLILKILKSIENQ